MSGPSRPIKRSRPPWAGRYAAHRRSDIFYTRAILRESERIGLDLRWDREVQGPHETSASHRLSAQHRERRRHSARRAERRTAAGSDAAGHSSASGSAVLWRDPTGRRCDRHGPQNRGGPRDHSSRCGRAADSALSAVDSRRARAERTPHSARRPGGAGEAAGRERVSVEVGPRPRGSVARPNRGS
jgi:hypothetical protein